MQMRTPNLKLPSSNHKTHNEDNQVLGLARSILTGSATSKVRRHRRRFCPASWQPESLH